MSQLSLVKSPADLTPEEDGDFWSEAQVTTDLIERSVERALDEVNFPTADEYETGASPAFRLATLEDVKREYERVVLEIMQDGYPTKPTLEEERRMTLRLKIENGLRLLDALDHEDLSDALRDSLKKDLNA